MTGRRIANILKKEWQSMFSQANTALVVVLLPLLIVGQLILYVWLAVRFGGDVLLKDQFLQSALDRMMGVLPSITGLTLFEQFQVLLLSQFTFFLLLIPTMIAMNTAAFSIVEEKTSRSLEPLLATPVRTWELLLGKALSGAIPALLMTWISAGVFLLVVVGLGWGHLIPYVLTPAWFISLFLLTPAVAVLAFMLGVIGSSRAADARSAQNIALVIVFPVLGLIALQIVGVVFFGTLLTLVLGAVLVIIDVLVLRIAISLFQRESIIIRWR